MITQLHAENFKSWKDTTELGLAPLTGLFGTNSSGKTSILQLLLMLKQTVESPDRKRILHTGDDRSLVDLGTFYDLIHEHQQNSTLRLSLSWTLPTALQIRDPESRIRELYNIRSLFFEVEIGQADKGLAVHSFNYQFDKNRFGMEWRGAESPSDRDHYDLIVGDYAARRTPGRPWPLPPPVKCYGFPDEATGFYQNTGFLPDFVLAFEKVFGRIAYLGPLREYPRRSYVWAGERPLDVGRTGDLAVPALLAARAEKLKSGRLIAKKRRYLPIEERIVSWMRDLGLIDSFSLRPIAENRKDYEVRVKKNPSSSEVLITDVGFGVSQILPVLVLCYYVPEGSTILLEQPEIHLHPSVQAGLADVLLDVVKERNVQVIVESHSEHLLRRLQRRIAEELLPSDMVALYFCSMERGSSSIEKLNIDEFGNISNWPRGFFGDEVAELTAMTEAAMQRQGATKE